MLLAAIQPAPVARRVSPARRVELMRANVARGGRPCMCSKKAAGVEGLGCGACPGMGSWLSDAFKKVTGTKLSTVTAPIASIVGSVVGGPVGGAIGTAIGGAFGGSSGGGGNQTAQLQLPAGQTGGGSGFAFDWAASTRSIVDAITATNRAALDTSNTRIQAEQAAKIAAAEAAAQRERDNLVRIGVVGGVGVLGLGVLLYAMNGGRRR